MASSSSAAPIGIAALPASTTRQLGSGQVLVDPSSVVKELIDNALDARAKSIFVDISTNTIDSIQVKDDGHGIPAEDRALVCRRYCTSKIRDFHDLREVGGKWLGFRGEALASLAGMSQALSVTTRVEGEPVAVKLTYDHKGELLSTNRDSHPIGTTVKATHFLEHLPVRKQTALKHANKVLSKIRRLVQAYALARPSVRFRLHILKASSNKYDFIYAPNTKSNVEDTALKVVGKSCALECEWTAMEAEGFEIQAFLPKPGAEPSKIAGPGAFVSIDSRPLSNNRGTVKKIVKLFKEHLRRFAPNTCSEPFFYMNISCPPDSYDPNIEPAKDDIMFDNEDVVLKAISKMFDLYYPQIETETSDFEPPTSAQKPQEETGQEIQASQSLEFPLTDATQNGNRNAGEQALLSCQPRWRSSMYGVDEDDLEFLQENRLPALEEEAGLRDPAISNPWTIARMNASVKSKISTAAGQLLSPTKSIATNIPRSSSPALPVAPHENSEIEATTPLSPMASDPLNDNTPGQICAATQQSQVPNVQRDEPRLAIRGAIGLHERLSLPSAPVRHQVPLTMPFVGPSPADRPRQAPNQHSDRNTTTEDEEQGPDCTLFGQPMNGSKPQKSRRRKANHPVQDAPIFSYREGAGPEPAMNSGKETAPVHRTSENDTDIRGFFAKRNPGRVHETTPPLPTSSFTPINRPPAVPQLDDGLTFDFSQHGVSNTSDIPDHFHARNTYRPNYDPVSYAPSSPSHQAISSEPIEPIGAVPSQSGSKARSDARVMEAHFKAYQDREMGFLDALRLRSDDPPLVEPSIEEPSRGRNVTTFENRRRKSSRAPLERTPRGCHTHNLVCSITVDMVILRRSHEHHEGKISDMQWGKICIETYSNAFTGRVQESRTKTWIRRLDHALHTHFEKLPGANIEPLLHQGIQKGLAAKRQEQSKNSTDAIRAKIGDHEDMRVIGTPIPEDQLLMAQKKVGDWMLDFDMSQFVHMEDEHAGSSSSLTLAASVTADNSHEDFENDLLMGA